MSLFAYDPWAVEYLRVLQRMREIGVARPAEIAPEPSLGEAGLRAVDLGEYIGRIKRGED